MSEDTHTDISGGGYLLNSIGTKSVKIGFARFAVHLLDYCRHCPWHFGGIQHRNIQGNLEASLYVEPETAKLSNCSLRRLEIVRGDV